MASSGALRHRTPFFRSCPSWNEDLESCSKLWTGRRNKQEVRCYWMFAVSTSVLETLPFKKIWGSSVAQCYYRRARMGTTTKPQQRNQNHKGPLNFFRRRLCTLQAHWLQERAEQGTSVSKELPGGNWVAQGGQGQAWSCSAWAPGKWRHKTCRFLSCAKRKEKRRGIIFALAEVATMHYSCFHWKPG